MLSHSHVGLRVCEDRNRVPHQKRNFGLQRGFLLSIEGKFDNAVPPQPEIETSTEEEVPMSCGRRGMIQVRARRRFDLTIHQQVWAMVERSATKRAWLVMDAAGRAVALADDQVAAIALAKRMIRDGSMPDPATAHAQLEQQIVHDHGYQHELEVGEPMELLKDRREMVPIGKIPNN